MVEDAGSSLDQYIEILQCPSCEGDLARNADSLSCQRCGQRFEIADGIPLLFWPTDDDDASAISPK